MFKIVKSASSKNQLVPVTNIKNQADTLNEFCNKNGITFTDLEETFPKKANGFTLLINAKAERFYFLNIGEKSNLQHKAIRHFFFNQETKGPWSVHFLAKYLSEKEVTNGAGLSSYSIGHLKNKESNNNIELSLELVGENIDINACNEGLYLATYQAEIMQWLDLPANHKRPHQVAAWMKTGTEKLGIKTTIFDTEACSKKGFHALLAVGLGSQETSPQMVEMHYKPKQKALKKIALVGKGVTFDTGGVSLKPGDNMNYMKSDMGGAAAVYGTIALAAKLELPYEIIGITPLTENCIDGFSVKPGDVINSYAGKTIEVINTDAEGRLILADALHFAAKDHKPDIIIDLATLTGNCIAALGYAAAALLSNNDDLSSDLYKAGLASGEKVWPMPLWDDYKDMMNSDIADLKNLSSAPVAGAITAAKFLEHFIDGHTSWAHLDIAGMAFGDSPYGTMKSASGYGIDLLITWMKNLEV